MSAPLLYVTGTNTAVGKTTLACLLLQRARERNLPIAAMKPFCTGGREDAEKLHTLQTAGLTLDELNPFYFTEPLTPYIAARHENRAVTLTQTIDSIKKIATRGHPLLIEGAGGLMSPLGDRFTLLDIIRKLPGKILIVAPNILGVLNSALLTNHALKQFPDAECHFVLMTASQPDPSATTNAQIVTQWTGAPTFEFPFLTDPRSPNQFTAKILDDLLTWWVI